MADPVLSPRARRMALWLCDLVNPALDRRSKAASADLLLRELPDHWTEQDAVRAAVAIRNQVGPKASYQAWLEEAGWLVNGEERLPEAPPHFMSEFARHQAQRRIRDMLERLDTPTAPVPSKSP